MELIFFDGLNYAKFLSVKDFGLFFPVSLNQKKDPLIIKESLTG